MFFVACMIVAATQTVPTPPIAQLYCSDISINFPTSDQIATAGFYDPAFTPTAYAPNKSATVCLDRTLPPPLDRWRLIEVNPSPGIDPTQGYVIIRNEDTGTKVALGVVALDGGKWPPTRPAPPPVLRPSTRPVPPPPGIGCVLIFPKPEPPNGEVRWYAKLVGGEYYAENDLGNYREGQLLPKPYDMWRVKEVFQGRNPVWTPLGPDRRGFVSYVVLRNEQTGNTVKIERKSIGLPHRPTTQPVTTG
jgi:hypothetical protein